MWKPSHHLYLVSKRRALKAEKSKLNAIFYADSASNLAPHQHAWSTLLTHPSSCLPSKLLHFFCNSHCSKHNARWKIWRRQHIRSYCSKILTLVCLTHFFLNERIPFLHQEQMKAFSNEMTSFKIKLCIRKPEFYRYQRCILNFLRNALRGEKIFLQIQSSHQVK